MTDTLFDFEGLFQAIIDALVAIFTGGFFAGLFGL